MEKFPLSIFYDGSCVVCRREMETYRNNNPQQKFLFIDINAADFVPHQYGKSHAEFMQRLHVRDGFGRFYTGVDAFMEIWQAYPSCSLYRLLSAFVGFPGISLLARGGYAVFARYRHLLPKHLRRCEDDQCSRD